MKKKGGYFTLLDTCSAQGLLSEVAVGRQYEFRARDKVSLKHRKTSPELV